MCVCVELNTHTICLENAEKLIFKVLFLFKFYFKEGSFFQENALFFVGGVCFCLFFYILRTFCGERLF